MFWGPMTILWLTPQVWQKQWLTNLPMPTLSSNGVRERTHLGGLVGKGLICAWHRGMQNTSICVTGITWLGEIDLPLLFESKNVLYTPEGSRSLTGCVCL